MVKNPNWWEADQLAIYKHDRGVELPGNNSSFVVRASPNHAAMLPPFVKYVNYNNIYSVGAFAVPFSTLSPKDMAKDVLVSK